MTIWDEISKSVSDAANIAAKKTGELTSVAKKKIALYSEQTKLAKTFEEIGRLYYASKRNGDDNVAKIAALFVNIEDIKAEIDRLKASLAQVSNSVICPGCGATYKKDYAFCPRCGVKNDAADPCESDECGCCCDECCTDETCGDECDCCEQDCECAEDCDCCEDENKAE